MYSSHIEKHSNLRIEQRIVEIVTEKQRKMRVEIGNFIESLFFLRVPDEAKFLHKNFISFYNTRMMMVAKT